jgi:hypothetical protein
MGVRAYSGTTVSASPSLAAAGTQFSSDGEITYLTARPTDFKFVSSANTTVEVAIYNYSAFATPALNPTNPILTRNFTGELFFTYTPAHRGYFLIAMTNLSPMATNAGLFISTQPGSFEPDLFIDLTILSFVGFGIFLVCSLAGLRSQKPSTLGEQTP